MLSLAAINIRAPSLAEGRDDGLSKRSGGEQSAANRIAPEGYARLLVTISLTCFLISKPWTWR